jgi:DNA modification methylase
MKPVSLVARAVMNSSKATDVVLDLFGGSGTTLIACEEVGRSCRMMELDPKYCDVIVKRWEQMTGRQAAVDTMGCDNGKGEDGTDDSSSDRTDGDSGEI